MKIVSATRLRAIETLAIERYGVTEDDLMDRAGFGVAKAIERCRAGSRYAGSPAHFIAGRGKNGGDAFVAARYMLRHGASVEVWLAGRVSELEGIAATQAERALSAGITVYELPDEGAWKRMPLFQVREPIIVIDAVMGAGLIGAPRPLAAAAIRAINRLGERFPVMALDVPSGIDADTGETPGDVVRADVTLTIGLPKSGLMGSETLDTVGAIEFVDIGLPDDLIDAEPADSHLITELDLAFLKARRRRRSHKGDYGRVLVVAGSRGFSGAAILAARAACRSGAGLVSVVTPECVAAIVAAGAPEAMTHPVAQGADGAMTRDSLSAFREMLLNSDAVIAGPGLGRGLGVRAMMERLLLDAVCPVVVDADALNACAGAYETLRRAACPLVLTPHPGELARLRGGQTADVEANRRAAASKMAADCGHLVALKGAETVIAGRTPPLFLNRTGNPGMATGGAGDVLAGLLGGFIAQGATPLDATCAAVFIHGRAGDSVAWRGCERSLIASDLIDALPRTLGELAIR